MSHDCHIIRLQENNGVSLRMVTPFSYFTFLISFADTPASGVSDSTSNVTTVPVHEGLIMLQDGRV